MSYALADALFTDGASPTTEGVTDRALLIDGEYKKVSIVGTWSIIPEERKDGKIVLEFTPDEESFNYYNKYGLKEKITIIESLHIIRETHLYRLTSLGEARYYEHQERERER